LSSCFVVKLSKLVLNIGRGMMGIFPFIASEVLMIYGMGCDVNASVFIFTS